MGSDNNHINGLETPEMDQLMNNHSNLPIFGNFLKSTMSEIEKHKLVQKSRISTSISLTQTSIVRKLNKLYKEDKI